MVTSIGIIIFGHLIRKTKILPDGTGEIISKFIIYITLPATIVRVFMTSVLPPSIIFLPLFGAFMGLITFVIGYLVIRYIDFDVKTKGALLISVSGYNIGIFAYPLVLQIYGGNGLINIAMFDVGNSFIVFGLDYIIACLYAENKKPYIKDIMQKLFFFIPLDVYVITIILTAFNIHMLPIIFEFVSQLALPNSMMALFAIGYFLDFDLNRNEIKALSLGVLIRYIPGILAFIIINEFFDIKLLFFKMMVWGAFMPVPMVAVIFSNDMKLNTKLASILVTSTTFITVIIVLILIWQLK